MDFSELINELAERAQKIKDSLNSEEATKMALVVPFIKALGYDVRAISFGNNAKEFI